MSEPERRSKRQRTSQACDYCRKRKSKCDGLQPVCSVCRLFKKPCTYGNVKKRGLQTGYVRGLESLLGLVLQHIPGSEALVQSLLRQDYADVSFTDGGFLDRTTDQWRTSDLAKDLDVLLSSVDAGSGEVTPQGSRLPPLPRPVTDAGCHPLDSSVEQRIEHTEPAVSGNRSEPNQEISPHLLSFPDDASNLVDLYFQTTQCWFPIVERRDILRTMYDEDETEPAHQPCNYMNSSRICLWAIVVYSSKLTEGNPIPSTIPSAWQIQAHIWSTLMSDSQTFDLGHIQAALILALHELSQGLIKPAWILTAQAYRMQTILAAQGLETPERKQHVFQGCLYLDTILSALLGQSPLHFHKKHNDVTQIDENAVEEWESWTPPSQIGLGGGRSRQPLRVLSTFNLLMHLMEKMAKFLEHPAEGRSFDETVRELQNWRLNLKKQHQMNDRGCSTPPILVLHLTWNFALLTVFRWTSQIEQRWIKLIEGAARSTLAMINQYLELTGMSSASPLPWIFAQQALACLQQLNRQLERNNESALDLQLKEMLQTLEHQHQDQASTRDDGLHAAGQTMRHPTSRLPLNYNGSSSGGNHRTQEQSTTYVSGASLHDSSAPAEASTSQAQDLPLDASLAAFTQTGRPSDEVNAFDDVFDEMLTFVPSRRYAEEATTFAQNLGFLSSDFDLNSLAFQQTDDSQANQSI